MEFYTIRVEKSAAKDLKKIQQSGKKSDISKIERIFKELTRNPYEGEGSPERLKYDLSGYWSRRINKKDRLIYKVNEDEVVVIIVSALGHYFDK
jgi:toxin YoeB